MRKFRLVNYADWGIDRSVSRARRARLLGKLSFEAIVERLLSEVRIMRITHEKGDNTKRGLHRWVITLIANPHTIDLWHNSRGGYRAQYYVDPAIGDAANTYACRALVSVAQRLIEQDNYRKHFWSRAAKSVCHSKHAYGLVKAFGFATLDVWTKCFTYLAGSNRTIIIVGRHPSFGNGVRWLRVMSDGLC